MKTVINRFSVTFEIKTDLKKKKSHKARIFDLSIRIYSNCLQHSN